MKSLAESPSLPDDDLGATREINLAEIKPSVGPSAVRTPERQTLGRFRLQDKLGEGGMGAVYRAENPRASTVAIKILGAAVANRPKALKRLLKEARLLSQVNNPFVANLLEVAEDDGVHYLVMEYVPGGNLRSRLETSGPLREPQAIAVMADVARALADAHARGIVHRDIKPENILLAVNEPQQFAPAARPTVPCVKLSDFGLARHLQQTESLNLTEAGALLGTPRYMAPEQFTGQFPVGPAADVYAMGVTLFELLAGRPPFESDDALQLAGMHCYEPPPPLQNLNPQASDGVVRIIDKALAKHPAAHQANAALFLADLESHLHGKPNATPLRPALPAARGQKIFAADFTWDLKSTPEQLWPYVSNTERLNQAVGLPSVVYTVAPDPERGLRRFGEFRLAGLKINWEEHPYEWIEGRRMGILREFTQGPFEWFVSTVELVPLPGGTRLTHRVRIAPRGLLGRMVAALEAGAKARRGLGRVYRRIDAVLQGELGRAETVDPFREAEPPSQASRRRLAAALERVRNEGVDAAVIDAIGEYLARAPAQELARIRPLELARRLGHDPDQVVSVCLHGAKHGLFVLMWDILCPSCRIAFEVKDTLRAIENHGHCEACNLDFELDFANSVELIFRPHAEIRSVDLGTYCIGGPEHAPHVVAQTRVQQGERVELELTLPEGQYKLRGPQLPHAMTLNVSARAGVASADIDLSQSTSPDQAFYLQPGRQVVATTNPFEREILLRLERTLPRQDVLSAARAATIGLFRKLYPGEVLSPGRLLNVAVATFLSTRLDHPAGMSASCSDVEAFGVLQEHMLRLDRLVRSCGGAVVKAFADGGLAVFNKSSAGLRAALDVKQTLGQDAASRGIELRAGLIAGPALAATINERLDYFGRTANLAGEIRHWGQPGELTLGPGMVDDPPTLALLREQGLELHSLTADRRTSELPAGTIVLPDARI